MSDPVLNNLYQFQADKDAHVEELFNKIISATQSLEDDNISSQKKYDIIVSVEYLFVRLRILIESESVQIKKMLTSRTLNPGLKTFFTKRDVYLAQLLQKLNSIREDISVLQKVVYSQNFR